MAGSRSQLSNAAEKMRTLGGVNIRLWEEVMMIGKDASFRVVGN